MILIKILEMIPRGKQPIVGKALALVQVILCLVILIQTSHSKRNFHIQILGEKERFGVVADCASLLFLLASQLSFHLLIH